MLSAPHPVRANLAVFKSDVSVQADPFQDSETAVLPGLPPSKPPATIADVAVPASAM